NPQHVASLLALARARKVRLVLQETYYPDATSKLVADKIPAPLVLVPGGTNFAGGQTDIPHPDGVGGGLAQALGGGPGGRDWTGTVKAISWAGRGCSSATGAARCCRPST